MLKRTITTALFALALPLAPAMAQDADTVVATVNGTEITLGEMIIMRQSMAAQGQAPTADDATWQSMLDQLVRQSAVASVKEEAMTAGDRANLELQSRAYLASAALEEVAEPEPTDEEIQAAYDTYFGEVEPATEYSAAHILVETEEAAKEIKTELDGGADFGTLAEERSTGPSGPNKGDLGWFTADQMVGPFADVVKEMEKGQISDPVKTDFGWHVIMLNDSRQVEAPELAEVKEQLVTQVRRDRVEAQIEKLVGEAEIEKTEGLDAALLDDVELLDAQ
ncbi:peptidylprolyl isomerase [Paracoccus tegillarcae]|uniref:Parvulin-like PPIase n=1 Tax=Paracoccus tegillarcae TaxID=1529068 RepID=A0A2K9EZW9_9RHOB|nr:peptidylprolyl isomerase [Paracoccus tegillarcae]AUH33642.1 peptidylprolyl isomerase [Paracoccus tegillarcae]